MAVLVFKSYWNIGGFKHMQHLVAYGNVVIVWAVWAYPCLF